MESTRPIRALLRGLDALSVLNSRDGATVSEIALEIRLPRTTVYRILETLCDSGFAARDAADDRYRLTIRVRALAAGYADDGWVASIAKPAIDSLCTEVGWPVAVATVSGTSMMLRETTDHSTPFAMERFSAGYRQPLLTSAAGRAYLAFCGAAQRESLLEALARSPREEDKPARSARADLQRTLAEYASQGFATATGTRRLVDEVSIGVPVLAGDGVFAVVSLRFTSSALALKAAIERFLPLLRQTVAKITPSTSEHPAAAQTNGTPKAAV